MAAFLPSFWTAGCHAAPVPGPPNPSLFSRSTDSFRPKLPRTSNINLFERPFSALARHRIHELSDIREASGSSKGGTVRKRKPIAPTDGTSEIKLPSSFNKSSRAESSGETTPSTHQPFNTSTPPRGLGSRAPSALSLPMTDVPIRKSSASCLGRHSATGSPNISVSDFPSWKLPGPAQAGQRVPSRGRADSPVRAALLHDAISTEHLRRSASRTFIRTSAPLDLLENGSVRHPRVEMTVRLPSPLFVGGGTIEGEVILKVDTNTSSRLRSKPIHISRLSIDVIGVEEVSDGRRWIFLSLATEMFDLAHPPPPSLIVAQDSKIGTEQLWRLKSSTTAVIPFCVNLPLNIGPPPYLSKQAGIRYLLCPTATIKLGEKQSIIRQTWNIQMLTVHDPEKALASLPDPLLASDTISMNNNGQIDTCKLTAGLHRQTWVNGAAIFVDIHVANRTSKCVKKIEIQIEKSTLWYAHAAAGTVEKSVSHLRLPKRTDKETVSNSILRRSRAWDGVPAHTSDLRTCSIDVPRGNVTISTGRYFEVRYFLSVIVTVGMFKNVAVQMPITLIHFNSLDILPNSLAQVAAAIELKRARTLPVNDNAPLYPHYHQGQAFTAPRRQSLDRLRQRHGSVGDDISTLAYDLDTSPRKYGVSRFASSNSRMNLARSGTQLDNHENTIPRGSSILTSSHHHHVRHPSCYHCQLIHTEIGRKSTSATVPPGPSLPRLQLSTSGLGFSDSEFEMDRDSPPRKVMLSEHERRMINQQRELHLQREASQRSHRAEKLPRVSVNCDGNHPDRVRDMMPDIAYRVSRNVVAPPTAGPKQPEYGNRSRFNSTTATASSIHEPGTHLLLDPSSHGYSRVGFEKGTDRSLRNGRGSTRIRSKTNPENVGMTGSSQLPRPRRATRSTDRRAGLSAARMSVDGPGPSIDRHRSRGRSVRD